jgi:hypothetical protein
VTLMTPSQAVFPGLLFYTLAGLCRIRSFKFMSSWLLEKWYGPSLSGARTLNNLYYVLKLMNIWWCLQQSSKICIVGILVLTGSSGLSKGLKLFIMYLAEQLLDRHTWYVRMLDQIESKSYGLLIIFWKLIPTGLYIKLQHQNNGVYEEDS